MTTMKDTFYFSCGHMELAVRDYRAKPEFSAGDQVRCGKCQKLVNVDYTRSLSK